MAESNAAELPDETKDREADQSKEKTSKSEQAPTRSNKKVRIFSAM